jgi:hypothetical protein
MAATHLSESRAYPVAPADMFAQLMPLPLPDLFSRRYVAIPPIREVRDALPTWDTVGQTRRIVLADGGTMHETLTLVDPPRAFGYTITDFTGPLSPLASWVDGTWSVDASGTGCRQQGAGEAAGTGPDLQHVAGGKIACQPGDASRQVQIEQEVLPERLARREPVRGDHLAQRRQAVG